MRSGRGRSAAQFQVVPFQCRIRVWELPWLTLLVLPTAQAFRAEVAATAESRALAQGLGLDTRFHEVPFHHKVRVFVGPSPLPVSPTAQALPADVAATLLRLPARLGPGACFHAAW
jgi:hypothetical protein